MMYYIGIDPGFKGIITILENTGKLIDSISTPLVEITGKSIKHWYDIPKIIEILKKYKNACIILEKQTVISGQGLVTSGRIMRGFGMWEGILSCLYGDSFYIIDPKKWQNFLYKKYVNNEIQFMFANNDYQKIIEQIDDTNFKTWYEKYITNKISVGKIKSSFIYYSISHKIYNDINMLNYKNNNITDSFLISKYCFDIFNQLNKK
jgi:hypothetical protein